MTETAAYRQSRKDRKKVEVLFAHLKRMLKLDRLRLRGRRGARVEFLLAATAQKLATDGEKMDADDDDRADRGDMRSLGSR